MTLMTAMTMNCKGSLNGVRHSAVRSRDREKGLEHGEHKRDKARHCSHLVRPSGDRKKRNASSCRVSLTAHRVLVHPVQVSLLAQPWRRTRTWTLPSQHFLHYFSEEVSRGKRGIRTAENTPSTRSGEEGSSVSLVHAHEVVRGGRSKLRVVG
jgi:hypothetical protein